MPKSLIGKVINQVQVQRHNIPFPGPMTRGNGLYGSGIQDRFTMMNTMGTQGTLFAIIQLLSTGKHAHGPWELFRQSRDNRVRYSTGDVGSDQRVEVLQHQALRLWNQPNAFMTGFDFREIGWQHMELAGEWYWVLNRGPSGKSIPTEMWPVRPDRMEPVPDRDKFLAGWVYSGPSGEAVPLSVDEVIQLRYPHPTDVYRGLSPVQAVLADIDAAKYSAEWSRNFFLNSAQPGGIVTFNKRLTDEEFNEFTNRWREQHQGVARGHRVGVLEQGATWTANTYTMRDMQFPELRKVTSDHIRQGYRIHQAMLGDSTDVNRANAQTALEIHVAFHEIPRLDREKNVLNTRFLAMFGAQDTVEFDYPNPFPPNREESNAELQIKSMAAFNLISAGYDPHDVLEVVGLPDMATAVEASSTTQVIPPRWVPVPPGAAPAALPPGQAPAGAGAATPQAPAGATQPTTAGNAPAGPSARMRKLAEGHHVVTEPDACDECKAKARKGDCAPPFHYGCQCRSVENSNMFPVYLADFDPDQVISDIRNAFKMARNGNGHG